jgi:tetratricopeptide (TPR) repeat protein
MKNFLFLLSILFLIISFGQTAEEYNSKGNTKRYLQDFKGAIVDYTNAIELDPTNAYYYYNRGKAKGMAEDYRGAIADYTKAIELDPIYVDAYYNRGHVKYLLNEKNAACSDWSKAGVLGDSDAYELINKYCDKIIEIETDNQNPVIVSDFCYNEIPPGVQLVQTESEWLMLSKTKACCCYPSFNSQNKSLGLLYNYKAYALIKQKLLNDQEGISVCSKEDWGNILKQIEQNHQMIQTLQFNDYPGYYDEDWYTPELGFSAYWLDENSMYTFSKQTYGEPMLDDQLFDERQRTCALSIRIVKSSKINCNKKKWLNDPIYYRGENNNKGENNIKYVSKVQDWIKNSNDGIASCCYLNFDNNNQSYGFLYNYAAYILLKLKPIVYAEENLRVATEIDWNKLISCYGVSEDKIGGSFAESLGGLAPNGFFDGNFWQMPEDDKSLESKCSFWVGENSSNTYTFVDPENYKGNPWPENVTLIKQEKSSSSAYFIQFIKQ